MSRKICIVVGTRPEAIKMAPIYRQARMTEGLEPILVSTGQHKEMLLQSLAAFDLSPDYDLGLMRSRQTLPDLTARAISALSEFFEQHAPDAVLLQGDTTSVLAGAIAAFYQNIPVGHVEAGLRTHDLRSPYPEEMNRRLTSPLSEWNFAPTDVSKNNLLAEGIAADKCFVTGNTVIDALFWMRELLQGRGVSAAEIVQRLKISEDFSSRYLGDAAAPFLLVTGHRRESFGDGFHQLCDALLRIVQQHPEVGILYPVHLNPAVRDVVHAQLGSAARIELIEPVGYEDFVWLMDRCRFMISDSGGVQEEAPSFGKPVLVTRDTTERPEGVTAGTCELVGTDADRIVERATLLLTDKQEYERRSHLKNPYGDGTAAKAICGILNSGAAAE